MKDRSVASELTHPIRNVNHCDIRRKPDSAVARDKSVLTHLRSHRPQNTASENPEMTGEILLFLYGRWKCGYRLAACSVICQTHL